MRLFFFCTRRRREAAGDGGTDREIRTRIARISNSIRDDRHHVIIAVDLACPRARVDASTRASRWIHSLSIDVIDRIVRASTRARRRRRRDAMVGSASRGRGNDPTRRHRSTFRSTVKIDRLVSIGDRDRERSR